MTLPLNLYDWFTLNRLGTGRSNTTPRQSLGETIWRWVQRYGPELEERRRRHLKPPKKSWRVDEPEDEMREILDRRCDPPGELIRTFVKGCGGDWEHARRRLSAAHGDIARAIVALKRTPQRAQVGQPASPNDPAAVRDYRARQRGG